MQYEVVILPAHRRATSTAAPRQVGHHSQSLLPAVLHKYQFQSPGKGYSVIWEVMLGFGINSAPLFWASELPFLFPKKADLDLAKKKMYKYKIR